MIPFLLLLIVGVFWIWGVRCVFSTGHILERVGDWVEDKLPEWIYKPTIGCQACMSSIHGSLWYWTFGILLIPVSGIALTLIVWVLYCVCLCGVNFILLESIYKEEE